MKLFLRPQVERELEIAADWYEEKQEGLRDRFLGSVEECLERISNHPWGYQIVHLDIHRAPVHRYPYSVFYFLLRDRVEVIAVVQDARHPSVWKRRRRRAAGLRPSDKESAT